MTYSDEVAKTEIPNIAELFKFTVGDDIYYYTNYSRSITFGGNTYIKRSIDRSSYENDSQTSSDQIEITLPVVDFVLQFIVSNPIEDIEIDISTLFIDSGFSYQIFRGKYMDISGDDQSNSVKITFQANTEILRAEFPGRQYQSSCPFATFRKNCGLNREDFEVVAPVTISGSTLVSSIFDQKPSWMTQSYFDSINDDWLTFGFVIFGNNARWITNHSGDTITLQQPFDSRLVNGSSVNAYPGDDKSRDTCENKFNNVARWGGFQNIPSTNHAIFGFTE